MSILDELRKQKKVMLECPSCRGTFRAADANLFDATTPLKGEARAALDAMRRDLADDRSALAARKAKAKSTSRVGAETTTIGTVVEKIAPSLPGFPLLTADCRALYEPIDYVLFKGYSVARKVDAIGFVEIKSGNARLSQEQRTVRRLVESGRLELVVVSQKDGKQP